MFEYYFCKNEVTHSNSTWEKSIWYWVYLSIKSTIKARSTYIHMYVLYTVGQLIICLIFLYLIIRNSVFFLFFIFFLFSQQNNCQPEVVIDNIQPHVELSYVYFYPHKLQNTKTLDRLRHTDTRVVILLAEKRCCQLEPYVIFLHRDKQNNHNKAF